MAACSCGRRSAPLPRSLLSITAYQAPKRGAVTTATALGVDADCCRGKTEHRRHGVAAHTDRPGRSMQAPWLLDRAADLAIVKAQTGEELGNIFVDPRRAR